MKISVEYASPRHPNIKKLLLASHQLMRDLYPEETTWELHDASQALVASGGPFEHPTHMYNTSLTLPEGAYTFTIHDSHSDGLCCSYGDGSYMLTTGDDRIAMGGAFSASSESHTFVLPSVPV